MKRTRIISLMVMLPVLICALMCPSSAYQTVIGEVFTKQSESMAIGERADAYLAEKYGTSRAEDVDGRTVEAVNYPEYFAGMCYDCSGGLVYNVTRTDDGILSEIYDACGTKDITIRVVRNSLRQLQEAYMRAARSMKEIQASRVSFSWMDNTVYVYMTSVTGESIKKANSVIGVRSDQTVVTYVQEVLERAGGGDGGDFDRAYPAAGVRGECL